MLTVWIIILVPWFLFAIIGSGMAFEGGHPVDAYLFIAMAWSYPILVAVAFLARRKYPRFVWLPLITGLLMIVEDLVWRFGSK